MEFSIRNIVASGAIERDLSAPEVSRRIPGAKLEKRKTTTVQFRLENEKVTVLVTSKGKIILTGARSFELLDRAYSQALGKVQLAGIDVSDARPVRVHNLVATCDFATEIQLERLQAFLLTEGDVTASYEPEIFPGLIMKGNPGPSLLLFASGKAVCTGGQSLEAYSDLIETVQRLTPLVVRV